MSVSIRELQDKHRFWLIHNFPEAKAWEALAGLIEELGELAHAHLKGFRGIRDLDTEAAIRAKKEDALGDLFIYMMSYANTNNLDLESSIMTAWSEVGKRDWIKNPKDGIV